MSSNQTVQNLNVYLSTLPASPKRANRLEQILNATPEAFRLYTPTYACT